MKILNVSIRNFRLLRNFDLVLDKADNNLVFINGSNGHGKTSLLGAFQFCFFDQEIRPEDFSDASLEELGLTGRGEISVTVKLELNQDGDFALVTRSQAVVMRDDRAIEFSGRPILDVTLAFQEPSTPSEVHPDPEFWLAQNLPSRFKSFFLFDGELMYKFFDVSVKGAIEQAVKEIAQIDLFEEILDSVRSHRNLLSNRLGKISGTDAEKLEKALATSREALSRLVSNGRQISEQQEGAEKRQKELTKQLEAHKDAGKFLARNKELQESLDRLDSQRRAFEEAMNKEILQAGVASFLVSRADYPLKKHIKEADERGKYPANFKPEALEKLIQEDECICGRHLSESPPAKSNLERLLERSKNAGPLGAQLQIVHDSLLVSRGVAQKSSDSVVTNTGLLRDVRAEILKLKAEKDKLEPKLEGIRGNADLIQKLSSELKSVDNELLDLKARSTRLAEDYSKADSQVKADQKKFDKATSNSSEAVDLRRKLSFLEGVIQESDGFSEKVLEGVRSRVEEFVSSHFSKVKQGKFKTQITEDFEVLTLNQDGSPAELSEGQKMLKAYIFSIALREVVGLSFPLIVDTPFGRIDERNREALAEALRQLIDPTSGSSQQVIFMMHDGEYTPYTKKHFDQVKSSENYLELIGPGNESTLKSGIDPAWFELTAWADWKRGSIK